MQFSEQWLRTLVDPSIDTKALAHLLTMSGLEVEECVPVAPSFDSVVVGIVRAVATHPHADRLRVCEVDVGTGAALQIVCGAPNVVAGMKVPVALVGATLPGGIAIKHAEVRKVASAGMLCSAKELGLSEDHAGLLALPADAPVGAAFRDYYALDDVLITVKLTPNKADCLSVLGVAREVSALTGVALTLPSTRSVAAQSAIRHPIKITDADGCGRFTGRVIRNVNAAAPTPEWMKRRLERAGQRPIAALVDVTNYVMLELGRPLHVYDLEKLRGTVDVRYGRVGETLTLLNGQTVELNADFLCIADDRGPIGLAGIMGGESTKAETTTQHVLLESAFFWPEKIMGRARRLGFSSDASHRFERGVDPANNIDGIERATQLILEICGGEAGPTDDVIERLPERLPVNLRTDRARKVIGVPIADAQMVMILERLNLSPRLDGAVIVATPPSYRFDIAIEEDLIEEVARVYGFDNIPALPPKARAAMRSQSEARRDAHAIRALLAHAGYQEVINFSFVDAQWDEDLSPVRDPIKLLNPIANQFSQMRTSLMGGLIANIRYNVNRGQDRVRVFEVGRAYLHDARVLDGPLTVAGIHQPMRVAAAAYGAADDPQWGSADRAADLFDLKGDVEALLAGSGASRACFIADGTHPALHPGRSARIECDGQTLGWLGELHPRWVRKAELGRAPMLFELDLARLLDMPLPAISAVPKVPAVARDIAMLFPESVAAGTILERLNAVKLRLVQSVKLFDLYAGLGVPEGRKSLALRVVMQDTEKTLTDADSDAAMAKIREILEFEFAGELRK